MAVPKKYDTKPYAYGFQKDSPYLGIFNYYIKEMREKGALQKIQKKYDPPDQVTCVKMCFFYHELIN